MLKRFHDLTQRDPRLKLLGILVPCALIAVLCLYFLTPETASPSPSSQHVQASMSDDLIQPIVAPSGLDPVEVELGRKLFFDPSLSHDDTISCASCHNLGTGGTDHKAHPLGIHGAVGEVNAPTVLNSGLNFSQFWDGRAGSLEQQIDGPVQSAVEMGSTWQEVIEKLSESTDYLNSFRQIYQDGITRDHIQDAIAVFERSLVTPNSRFDRYLNHDLTALSPGELEGYRLFTALGCSSCHQGMNLGGNMYQKLGVMGTYFDDRGHITVADRGRFNVTGDSRDLYMFKVPSLRNVALTAPYFHDGTATTLEDAVRMMGKYQLGRKLTPGEVELLVEFLKTLTGELDGKPL